MTEDDRYHTDPALMLLDERATLHHCSPAAQAVLDANGGIVVRVDNRLSTPPDRTGLQRVIKDATRGKLAAMALARPGRLPLSLRCSPAGDGRLWMLLCDPDLLRVDTALLRQMFDLTATEARIGAALSQGLMPQAIAFSMRVQLNTVQTHIKRLLAKTGTNRQAQLVALLSSSAAVVGS